MNRHHRLAGVSVLLLGAAEGQSRSATVLYTIVGGKVQYTAPALRRIEGQP